jgi:hypothetical protein
MSDIETISGQILNIERRLVLHEAGHTGLRRFVLEWYSEQTGTPMNKSVEKVYQYVEEEYARILASKPENIRALLDMRGQEPPKV